MPQNALGRSPDPELGFLPPVIKSNNLTITGVLIIALFRSEVSLATVCTTTRSALTRLCRFMQIGANPQDAVYVGLLNSASCSFHAE